MARNVAATRKPRLSENPVGGLLKRILSPRRDSIRKIYKPLIINNILFNNLDKHFIELEWIGERQKDNRVNGVLKLSTVVTINNGIFGYIFMIYKLNIKSAETQHPVLKLSNPFIFND